MTTTSNFFEVSVIEFTFFDDVRNDCIHCVSSLNDSLNSYVFRKTGVELTFDSTLRIIHEGAANLGS